MVHERGGGGGLRARQAGQAGERAGKRIRGSEQGGARKQASEGTGERMCNCGVSPFFLSKNQKVVYGFSGCPAALQPLHVSIFGK